MLRGERLFSGLRPPSPGGWTTAPIATIPPDDQLRALVEGTSEPIDLDGLDGLDSPSVDALTDAGVRIVVPLVAEGDLVGLLNLGQRPGGDAYSDRDRELLTRVAGVAGTALRLAQLRRAVTDDEFVLHYQPKVDLDTREVHGVEALVRWRHADRGIVPPNRFVPLVERSDLIRDVTLWVLERALADHRAWRETGLAIPVAVNLSPRLLLDDDLTPMVVDALERHDVEPGDLQLELTETAFTEDEDRVLAVTGELARAGIRLAIDDFGTGYSSLVYLRRLTVDDVKVDKSFVMDLVTNESDRIIVRSTISLSHELGFGVIAEGVEDERTARLLTELGCDVGQGYLWSRPLPADELVTWMAARD